MVQVDFGVSMQAGSDSGKGVSYRISELVALLTSLMCLQTNSAVPYHSATYKNRAGIEPAIP
jgi:hypothetical protein